MRPMSATEVRRRSRLVTAATLALALAASLLAARPVGAATGDQMLPNLKATPAKTFSVTSETLPGASTPSTLLRFTTFSWNAGTGPLELFAGTIDSSNQKQDVWQRIFLEGGGSVERLAGSFTWDGPHNHFHFDDYASYTLQPADASGAASRIGAKRTFCVMDTNAQDLTLPGAPRNGYYTTCGSSYQGMSVGWGDQYSASLSGQWVDVTGLPNGDYRLTIEIDPLNHLSESTRTDNTSCVLLRLSVTNRTVTVLNPNSCEPALAVSSLDPTSMKVGTSTTVTIAGTALTSGLAVSFANGNGPTPTVSNVTWVSSTQMTATVTVTASRKKAKVTDPVWDLRVGTATLANALTVSP